MNTSNLRVLLVLAETKSINKAAQLLYMTAPTVKHALDSLEAEAGFALFDRSHAGLEITRSVKVFAGYAERTLALLDEGISLASEASTDGQKQLDAPWMTNVIQDPLFPSAFATFQLEHPEIVLNFRRVPSFLGEHYDVINGFADVTHTHAVSHPLSHLPLCCIVAKSHPLAGKKSIGIEELSPYRLFVPRSEMFDLMDDHARSFLNSDSANTEPITIFQEGDLFSQCFLEQCAAIVIGEWAVSNVAYADPIPIEETSFEYCLYTQSNPSASVATYVAFMQDYYATA